jgi:hypothetical protein
MAAKIRKSSQFGLPPFIYETRLFEIGRSHAFLKSVNQLNSFGKRRVAMTCIWNGLRNGLVLPLIVVARLWRAKSRASGRIPMLDPRLLNAHWRRDLGFDN